MHNASAATILLILSLGCIQVAAKRPTYDDEAHVHISVDDHTHAAGLLNEHSFLFEKELRHETQAEGAAQSQWRVGEDEQEAIGLLLALLTPDNVADKADVTIIWDKADSKDTFYRDVMLGNPNGPRDALLDHLLFQHGFGFVLATRGIGTDDAAVETLANTMKEAYPVPTLTTPIHQYLVECLLAYLRSVEAIDRVLGNTKLNLLALRHLHAFDHAYEKGDIIKGKVGFQAVGSKRSVDLMQQFNFIRRPVTRAIKKDFDDLYREFLTGISDQLSGAQRKWWKIFKNEWLVWKTADAIISIPDLTIVKHAASTRVAGVDLDADQDFIEGTFRFFGGTEHPVKEVAVHVPVRPQDIEDLETTSIDRPPKVKKYQYVLDWVDDYFVLARRMVEGKEWIFQAEEALQFLKGAMVKQKRDYDPEPVVVEEIDDDGGPGR